MKNTALIKEKVKRLVKTESEKYIDYIWDYHMVPMVDYALKMADKLKADKDIVELAAWLHDISWIRGDISDKHNIIGAQQARKILQKFKYPKEKIKLVEYCILAHRGNIKRKTQEANCIAIADSMAHLDSLPALFFLAYTKQKMGIKEATHWLVAKIERGWQKLTPEAQEILKDKYSAFRLLFEK